MRMEFLDINRARRINGGVAVVIDVMRAYTVAAWALHRGARELVLMDEIESAIEWARSHPGTLLFKDGVPDSRFDLHNSPHQLHALDVQGRSIVQRTTAGTRAAVAAQSADHIYCASFVCATATAYSVARHSPELVSLVVSGGLDAEEDLACAEFIAEILRGHQPNAAPYLQRALDSDAAKDLTIGVERGYTGVSPEDPHMCVDLDRFDFAMEARESSGHLRLRKAGEMES